MLEFNDFEVYSRETDFSEEEQISIMLDEKHDEILGRLLKRSRHLFNIDDCLECGVVLKFSELIQ